MLNKHKVHGQSLLEMMAFMSVVAVILGGAYLHIDVALKNKMERLESTRNMLWAYNSDDTQATTKDYYFANKVSMVTQPIQQVTSLRLPLRNLKTVNSAEKYVAMALLTDPWSVKTTTGLVTEPAKITLAHYLTKYGFDKVLNLIGRLPLMKEFHSSSLRFGWVNPDATPYEYACEKKLC
jgi:hypothetical protein